MAEPDFTKAYILTASVAALAWDYCLTFDKEVSLVWSRPFTFGSLLFYVNRYLPFIDLPLTIHAFGVFGVTPAGCYNLVAASAWLQTLGICVAEFILILRTVAIWQRNIYIITSLGAIYTACVIGSLYFMARWTGSMTFMVIPDLPGCYFLHIDSILFVNYVLILTIETIVVALTVIRAVSYLRHSSSFWVYQLYKKGVLFFIYLLIFTLLNLVFLLCAPSSEKIIFSDPQRALHSIFCNRVIFLIFSQQQELETPTGSLENLATQAEVNFFPTVLETFMTPDDELTRQATSIEDGYLQTHR